MAQEHSPELREIQNGRYEIIGSVGSGGSSEVYKARDTFLDKVVAIKKLQKTASEVDTLRFQREAKLAGSLTHPNIQGVLDFGLIDDREPYLVLDFVEGETLAQRLKQRGPLETLVAIDLLIQVSRGLAFAHGKNVVHRDIKPSNIMLVADRPPEASVLILDFGLAKSVSAEKDSDQQVSLSDEAATTTRARLKLQDISAMQSRKQRSWQGSPTYMSPEQVQGQTADSRSDIYSVGCIAFEILTGVPPFANENSLVTAHQHVYEPPPRMSSITRRNIPRALEEIVYQCLCKEPAGRFSDGNALLTALLKVDEQLNDLLAQKQTQSKSTVFDTITALRPPSLSKKSLALIVAIVIGITGLMTVLIVNQLDEKRPTETSSATTTADDRFVELEPQGNFAAAGATDEDLQKLLATHNVIRLDLSNSSITDAGLRKLADVPLQKLVMQNRAVTSRTLERISDIHSLNELLFAENASFDVQGLKYLIKLKRLATLELTNVKLTEQALFDISRIKSLTWLDFEHGEGIKISVFKYLNNLPDLRGFDAKYSDLSDESFADMNVDSKISELNLELTAITDKVLAKLIGLKNLKRLTISHAEGITQKGVESFKKARPDVSVEFNEL